MLKTWIMAASVTLNALGSSEVQLKPPIKISLSSSVDCKTGKHNVRFARFAPAGDLLAVVLQDEPFWRSGTREAPWHLVLTSRDGQTVQQLMYDKPDRGVFFKSIFWSPDASHIAVETTKAVSFVAVSDGNRCQLPIKPAYPIGFVEGPLFVLNRPGKPSRTLEFYGVDCVLRESVPAPSAGPRGMVLPRGDGLVFQSGFGVLLTDARGNHVREVQFPDPPKEMKWPGIILDDQFADSGRVLCSAMGGRVRCFDLSSGDSISMQAEPPHGSRPIHTSFAGTRVAWTIYAPGKSKATADAILLLLSLPEGKGYSPSPTSWLVWDYRMGREVFRLPATRDIELAPSGEWLAAVAQDSVLIFELPLTTNDSQPAAILPSP